jgi:hypothetical protein
VAGPPPDRPVWWWPSHPSGLRGCHPSSFTFFFFSFSLTVGGPATPLGHWGGSATTRPAGLVVAEPPQWPKGVVEPPLMPPFFFHVFFFFFSLTGGGPATPLGHWGGWATTRPAGLVVAEPPQWPKGVVEPPPVPPFFFHVFFFFNRGWSL